MDVLNECILDYISLFMWRPVCGSLVNVVLT